MSNRPIINFFIINVSAFPFNAYTTRRLKPIGAGIITERRRSNR